MKSPENTIKKILFIFIPFSIGYFLSYLYRSTNAVLAPYLNQDLGINAEQLGLITSVYFLTFALFQLPLGILLDKYGARKVQTILFIIASIGAATFALGNDVLQLTIGRGLIALQSTDNFTVLTETSPIFVLKTIPSIPTISPISIN